MADSRGFSLAVATRLDLFFLFLKVPVDDPSRRFDPSPAAAPSGVLDSEMGRIQAVTPGIPRERLASIKVLALDITARGEKDDHEFCVGALGFANRL
jgi:hypothetical protein